MKQAVRIHFTTLSFSIETRVIFFVIKYIQWPKSKQSFFKKSNLEFIKFEGTVLFCAFCKSLKSTFLNSHRLSSFHFVLQFASSGKSLWFFAFSRVVSKVKFRISSFVYDMWESTFTSHIVAIEVRIIFVFSFFLTKKTKLFIDHLTKNLPFLLLN